MESTGGVIVVFFFKQKTAYEIQYGLVGSEMCIRDSNIAVPMDDWKENLELVGEAMWVRQADDKKCYWVCFLYTSDAADERSSVDFGGRRFIKKKNEKKKKKRDKTRIKNIRCRDTQKL